MVWILLPPSERPIRNRWGRSQCCGWVRTERGGARTTGCTSVREWTSDGNREMIVLGWERREAEWIACTLKIESRLWDSNWVRQKLNYNLFDKEALQACCFFSTVSLVTSKKLLQRVSFHFCCLLFVSIDKMKLDPLLPPSLPVWFTCCRITCIWPQGQGYINSFPRSPAFFLLECLWQELASIDNTDPFSPFTVKPQTPTHPPLGKMPGGEPSCQRGTADSIFSSLLPHFLLALVCSLPITVLSHALDSSQHESLHFSLFHTLFFSVS